MKNPDNYCIIMAGGIGSRFWPMSKPSHPKQFIDILGTGETLIQQTYNRLKRICPKENIFVVTNKRYKALTLEQLQEIGDEQIICEPIMRNTAPCIAYANFKIAAKNPNANIIVAPADHLILKEDEFERVINLALNYTATNDCLVTLGIVPSRPDTGYGYIQFNRDTESEIKQVKTFIEKPTLDIAEKFIESGDFCWNSGMFIWSIKAIQTAYEKLLPGIYASFKEGEKFYNTPKENAFIEAIYATCKNISIDYGIMEKSKNVYVISATIGWSDLGTWGSIYNHLPQDENENALAAKNIMLYESSGNIINIPANKLVVVQGLKDYIVVDTATALLICKKKDEQKIKQFVSDIKLGKNKHFY